jgi:hypothetical protein
VNETDQQPLPPSSLPPINWERWASWHLELAALADARREPRLDPAMYARRAGKDLLPGMAQVTRKVPAQIEPGAAALFMATEQRLEDIVNWLSLQYSAGAPVSQLAEVWPYAMRWAEEFAMFHEGYHRLPDSEGYITPHSGLRTEAYAGVALPMVCWCILTEHSAELPRVASYLDYGNELMDVRDGLLERFFAPFIPGRGEPPDTATRHLPYRKLFKVFAAEPSKRPALMVRYLDDWYEASRREPYYDQHLEGGFGFYGYWSWEAATTTYLLDIDDSSYRDMDFYPRDLVDYARSLRPPTPLKDAPLDASTKRLRCEAGQPCPQAGFWSTPAQANSRRAFKAGELMPEFKESSWGATVWYWDGVQTP